MLVVMCLLLQYLELLWLQVKKMRENEWKVRGLVPGCCVARG